MIIKMIVTAFLISLPFSLGAEPRTLHGSLVKAVPQAVPQNQCNANPVIWEIPARHDQVTISYLSKNNKVLFERDFSVEGSNKIRIVSRKDN